jgi:hypothetical protein
LEPADVDVAIVDAQRRIVEALNLGLSSLFQPSDDASDDFVLTHNWSVGETPALPPRFSARVHFPWSLARIREGETAKESSLNDVPDVREREILRRYGTRGRVAIPLRRRRPDHRRDQLRVDA